MQIKELEIKGIYEINLSPIIDERGFFMRTYDTLIFEKFNIKFNWVQENHSRSLNKGIIRGLHLQLQPFVETKLIRCIRGSIMDYYVDLRKDSNTFGKWGCTKLSASNNKALLIPKGFAHGFCTLTKFSEVIYKVDNFYSKDHEIGIIWNDKDLNIKWPDKNHILSKKDQNNISIEEFVRNYEGINL